ncbi:putative xylanase/chitin deacetylase [Gottschalkia purinilytica]|uniref:Putative xylanase/chitin deacetylase n=1 Tax=Gottschalkia purinilytica TaxID=1503 RepID=A0A0L0WE44_GOTPU|nr:polysaccharide deacetylase family protein [Gottschalkia purinilytica]KNF09706.1 putative xylanase/chitin deacetylase [Gottschalkia purinilytica]
MKKFILALSLIIIFFQINITSYANGEENFHKKISKGVTNKVPVLMYHHIMNSKDIKEMKCTQNATIISDSQFKKEMKFLHDNGYYTATLDELRKFIKGQLKLPKKTVVITFDDGYLSNLVYAYPILKKYHFNAAIFMIGNLMSKSPMAFDRTKLQYISSEELDKYKDVFYYGSHTYGLHDIKDGKGYLVTSPKAKVIEDLNKSKNLLNTDYLAYPYGQYNSSIIECLKEKGYKMAFTIQQRYAVRNSKLYEVPRFAILPNTSMSEFKDIVSGRKVVINGKLHTLLRLTKHKLSQVVHFFTN